jgi:hypothetical protein
VDRCVRRFNRMDSDGWICTIERDPPPDWRLSIWATDSSVI